MPPHFCHLGFEKLWIGQDGKAGECNYKVMMTTEIRRKTEDYKSENLVDENQDVFWYKRLTIETEAGSNCTAGCKREVEKLFFGCSHCQKRKYSNVDIHLLQDLFNYRKCCHIWDLLASEQTNFDSHGNIANSSLQRINLSEISLTTRQQWGGEATTLPT